MWSTVDLRAPHWPARLTALLTNAVVVNASAHIVAIIHSSTKSPINAYGSGTCYSTQSWPERQCPVPAAKNSPG